MEGTQSEEIFDLLNLNPQLFINEVLNTVDDVVDGAFEFYELKAWMHLGDIGQDGSDELSKGVSSVRNILQEGLDKRMGMWEKYCLQHCFVVPEGFSLPKSQGTSGDSLMGQDALSDPELDSQLDSLREKLSVVGKESSEMQRELHAWKKKSTLSNSCAESVTEALQLFEQNSVHDRFQEMAKTAAEFRAKMEKLKIKRMAEFERRRTEMIYDPNKNQSLMHCTKGLDDVDLKDLNEFLAELKKM